jgi:hypothetical protein
MVFLTLLLPLWAIGCSRQSPPIPAEQLQIKINLLCTTCDDFLQCTRTGQSVESEFRLYRLREKSFFAQIATIWDYLIQWFHQKTNDRRPLTIYLEQGSVSRVLVPNATAKDSSRYRIRLSTCAMAVGSLRVNLLGNVRQ